ncbi:hypothetical protein HK104_011023 [Borealophlyctis nickersoniae]|nr:hypothetical protein HK104_011023 [Borealophlyctis nickersoniae]
MGGCCTPAKWKREHLEDHKFDLIDVDDFVENDCWRKFSYSWVFGITLKSILVYMADIGILLLIFLSGPGTLFTSNAGETSGNKANNGQGVSNTTVNTSKQFGQQVIPQHVRPWLQLGTVVLSFLLLAIEWRKGLLIVKSRDISYAFTNLVAYRYYVIRSYAHFCFFEQIQNSRKTLDILAFYVFFTFRGWKRLLLAEMPRALLNTLNLYDVINLQMTSPKDVCQTEVVNGIVVNKPDAASPLCKPVTGRDGITVIQCPCLAATSQPFGDAIKQLFLNSNFREAVAANWLTLFTVVIWTISAIQLIIAAWIYIPLLFKIRGNLKEYCCHKVDKRISELLRRKSRKRLEQARKAELKEIEKNGGRRIGPTLPDVGNVDLSGPAYATYYDEYETGSAYGGSSAASEAYHPSYHQPASNYAGSNYAGSAYGGGSAYRGYAPQEQYGHMPPLPMDTQYQQQMQNRALSPQQSEYDYGYDQGSEYGIPTTGASTPVAGAGPAYSHTPPPTASQYRDSIFSDVNPGPAPGALPPSRLGPGGQLSHRGGSDGYRGTGSDSDAGSERGVGGYYAVDSDSSSRGYGRGGGAGSGYGNYGGGGYGRR